MILVFCILIGLAIGSFLNVCIFRIPVDESVIRPRSRCPNCKKSIANRDNIPILSYILLGGKCRHCKKKISIRYPFIEGLTAVISGLIYLKFDIGVEWVVYLLFSAAMIALAFIDADHRILPDVITLNGLWIGIVLSLFLTMVPLQDLHVQHEDDLARTLALSLFLTVPSQAPLSDPTHKEISDPLLRALENYAGFTIQSPKWVVSLLASLLGAAVGGGLLWTVREAYFRLRGVEGMGFGDVKMMAMVGAFIGTPLTLFTIMIGSILGSVIGVLMMQFGGKDRKYEMPFGTFLSLGAVLAVLYGNELILLYLESFKSVGGSR
jgi:leader peptidase (prepilin peptidase)/N-methyltransferase